VDYFCTECYVKEPILSQNWTRSIRLLYGNRWSFREQCFERYWSSRGTSKVLDGNILGRYRLRSAVLVSQLQVRFRHRLVCIHNCRRCCSLTLAACWTTRYCEGIPFFQPSHFCPCPCRRDSSKAVRELCIWTFCLTLCLQNLWIYFVEEISDSRLCCVRFLQREFTLRFWEFKIGQPTKVKPCRFPTTH
jgi:hypothetical protein